MLVCVVFMRVQIAIFLVGLTTPISATLVIPSLVRYVIQPWGQENVDFFVHTSPMDSIVMDDSDIIDSWSGKLLAGYRRGQEISGDVRAKKPIRFDTEQAISVYGRRGRTCVSTILPRCPHAHRRHTILYVGSNPAIPQNHSALESSSIWTRL